MKLIRIIFSVVALFIIVCTIAVSALVIFIDPNKLKPVIAAEIKRQTGYEVTITGNCSWSFYPNIGVKMEHITICLPKQTEPMLELQNVTLMTELTQLDIYIADVKLLNMHAQKAHVGVHWRNQALTLTPITAALYGGTLQGNAQCNDLSTLPQWDWDMQFTNIQLQPLLQDIYGVESSLKISSLGQVKLRATAQGMTRDQIFNSLNGASEFSLQNGVIEGIDLNYLVRSADALINKQPLVVPASISQTTFSSLIGTAIIKNGVIATNDLTLVAPALMVNGAGSINLIFQAINLQLRITPQQEAQTQWVIPVMVTGNLYRPDVKLDATELNIMMAKEKLEMVKTKVSEEIKEHFSGKTEEFLQDLLRK